MVFMYVYAFLYMCMHMYIHTTYVHIYRVYDHLLSLVVMEQRPSRTHCPSPASRQQQAGSAEDGYEGPAQFKESTWCQTIQATVYTVDTRAMLLGKG